MAQPLVTVVTPSYNQGSFIRATIESVLSQNYPAIEYIIMDGGSTDETASVVKDYASRLTWISEKDRGQSHAINKGFQMAKGEIVSWLNSDDLFLPGAVARAAAEMDANPHYGAVYGEGYLIDRAGEITQRFPCTEPFNLWKLVHLSDYILQQTVYFRRSVLEEVGYIDEDFHYVMDWDILIRIGKRYELGYIPEFMGCLREYPEAKSFAGGPRRIAEIRKLMMRHTGQRFAPGYIVYGLDTYRKIWCERMESRAPALLRAPARLASKLVDRACLAIVGDRIVRSQGWFPDGWAGSKLKLMAPECARLLVITGDNSTGTNALRVYSNGRLLWQVALPAGAFTARIPLPDLKGQCHSLELRTRGTERLIPSVPPARRFHLKSVRCEVPGGATVGLFSDTAASRVSVGTCL